MICKRANKVCVLLLIGAIAWGTDSLVDFINPNPHSLWHRILLAVSLMGLSLYVYNLYEKLKNAEKRAYTSQAIMQSAFESTALGMCVTAMDRSYVALNQAYCQILGFTKEEMINSSFQDYCHPEDKYLDEPYIKALLKGDINYFNSVKRYFHKKGHLIWVKATVALVRDENGNPNHFVAQAQDITALREAEVQLQQAKEKAEHLALTDYLTGCLNRRAFVDRLSQEIERAKREHKFLAMILVDIDYFKSINDQHGHLTGDLVIQRFSQCLINNCRAYDFVGRYGGEEFVICLPNTNREEAIIVAERMRKGVEQLQLDGDQLDQIKLTGSFGIAVLDNQLNETIDSLIARADLAMYQAKQERNTLCVA